MEKSIQRKLNLDLLRILATIAVAGIHVSTLHYYDFDPRSFGWLSINFYDAIARWSVPVFVMISGALFLDEERSIDLGRLFQKNILRLLAAFVFWALIYAVCHADGQRDFWQRLFTGHFHMWFVLMIIGLYMLIPVLRKITADMRIAEYFLLVTGLAIFLIPALLRLPFLSFLESPMNRFTSTLSVGYPVYFVAGWYLSKKDFSKTQRILIYVLGAAGMLGTIAATSVLSYTSGKATPDPFYSYFSLEVMLEAVALFVFFRQLLTRRNLGAKTIKWIALLSKYSFGAYMAHILVLDLIQKLGLRVTSFPAIASVPVMVALVCGGSFAISAVIHQIPFLKRYVV